MGTHPHGHTPTRPHVHTPIHPTTQPPTHTPARSYEAVIGSQLIFTPDDESQNQKATAHANGELDGEGEASGAGGSGGGGEEARVFWQMTAVANKRIRFVEQKLGRSL